MGWSVSAEVDEFSEAVAYFRELVPMTQTEYEAIEDAARARAFTIAAHIELRSVQTIYDEIARSIELGTPIEDFRKRVEEKLGGMGPDGHMLNTVFVNANQQSYNVGRYEQMNEPTMNLLQPYRMFDAVLDSRTSPHCKAWDGVIRGYDDPCWLSHSPQCHHNCRSGLRSLRESQAREMGITTTLPAELADDGFGVSPGLRGNTVPSPNKDGIDDDVWAEFEDRLGVSRIELDDEQTRIANERSERDND